MTRRLPVEPAPAAWKSTQRASMISYSNPLNLTQEICLWVAFLADRRQLPVVISDALR